GPDLFQSSPHRGTVELSRFDTVGEVADILDNTHVNADIFDPSDFSAKFVAACVGDHDGVVGDQHAAPVASQAGAQQANRLLDPLTLRAVLHQPLNGGHGHLD